MASPEKLSPEVPFTPDLERIYRTFITTHWDWREEDLDPQSNRPSTLFEALARKMPHVTVDSWQSRTKWGGVFLNGKDAGGDCPLHPPVRIEYYEPRFDYLKADEFFPPFEESRICYEDEFLLVYVKPSRLPCVPAREQRYNNLRSYLDRYIGGPCHMPSRLDMSTVGLVPVSKHPMSHNGLQKVFQHRKITKRYRLKTSRREIPDECRVDFNITKHPEHPVLRCCSTTEGKGAVTEFKVLKRCHDGTVLEAKPITGRTHQIRVHALYAGFPLIGDNFYLGEEHPDLHLACYALSFNHPITGEALELEIPQELQPDWLRL